MPEIPDVDEEDQQETPVLTPSSDANDPAAHAHGTKRAASSDLSAPDAKRAAR